MSRTLPFRVEPLPGESLSSWLQEIANLHQSSLGELDPWIPRDVLRMSTRNLDMHGFGPSVAATLAHGSGVSLEKVESTWKRYFVYGERVLESQTSTRWLRPRKMSSFCATCLAENAGRWMAVWRLPWWCVCPIHHVYLERECHECGGSQKKGLIKTSSLAMEGWRCAATLGGGSGRVDRRCRGDLRNAPAEEAPQRLTELIRNLAAFYESCATEQAKAAMCHLDELYTMAKLRHGRQTLVESPSHLAGFLLGALEDLESEERFSEVILRGARIGSGSLLPEVAGLTYSATRAVKVRDEYMRPGARLKWRSPVDSSPPIDDLKAARLRWSSLPRALWPDWCLRIFPTCGAQFETLRQIALVAMVSSGSSNSLPDISAGMCELGTAWRTGTILSSFAPDITTGVIRNLIELQDQLTLHGSPIDYQRRRDTFGEGVPLTTKEWRAICRTGGILSGGPLKLTLGQLWLWEILTGEPVGNFPEPYENNESFAVPFHAFLRRLTRDARSALLAHARTLLGDAGIAEPVEWSPPREWVTGGIAGVEVEDIPIESISIGLRSGDSEREVARKLGVDSAVVAYCVSRNPPELKPRAIKNVTRIRPVPVQVTAEWIQQQRIEQRHGLRQIAVDTAVSRKVLAAILHDDGYELESGCVGLQVDPKWMREQYVEKKRTLPDIGRELGVSQATMCRIAKVSGIPVRSRGGSSHASVLMEPLDVREPLRSALRGHSAEQRVRRFQTIARCTSITEGARKLGIFEGVAVLQLQRLERDVGGQLIQRRTLGLGNHSQHLTQRGKNLLEQADDRFGLPVLLVGMERAV